MPKKRLPKSIKKYVRREKMRIRRQTFDLQEQEKQIQQLINRFYTDKKKTQIKTKTAKLVKESKPAHKLKPVKQKAVKSEVGKTKENRK
jgi:hypothetical protein